MLNHTVQIKHTLGFAIIVLFISLIWLNFTYPSISLFKLNLFLHFMKPNGFSPINKQKIARNITARIYLSAGHFQLTDDILNQYFSTMKSPLNRATPPIPINAIRLILATIATARTTKNIALRAELKSALANFQFPKALANIACQLPDNGIVTTNDVTHYFRYSEADESHIRDCLDNGQLRQALGNVRTYYNTAGISEEFHSLEILLETKAATFNVFTHAASNQNNEQEDNSELECATSGTTIITNELLPTSTSSVPVTKQSSCLDNKSNLLGRFTLSTVGTDLSYTLPTGFNAWSSQTWKTFYWSSGNLNFSISTVTNFIFGLYFNSNILLTMITTHCLRNFVSKFTSAELNFVPRNLVSSFFGSPEPAKEPEAPQPTKRAEVPKQILNITPPDLKPEGLLPKPKPKITTTVEQTSESLGSSSSQGAASSGPRITPRRRRPKRETSTGVVSYKPLSRMSSERTKLFNSLLDALIAQGFISV